MARDNYTGPEPRIAEHDRRESETRWHLDKKVPISMIVTILALGFSGIVAITDIKKDVEVMKTEIKALHERDNQQMAATKESLDLIRDAMNKIDDKLTRILERGK